MYVHSCRLEERGLNVEVAGVRPQVALRRLGRLLHHFAELAGECQALAIGQQRRFDIQHIAARFRPGQSC